MGLFAQRWSERKAGAVGYPATGWAPIFSMAGGVTSTGITVTQENAYTVAAFYSGVRVISEDVAKLPLILYRRLERGKERATDHPLYGVLHDAPNPEMTSFVFREALMGHLLTWGNAYAEKELDRAGRTLRLWPLRPDRMTVSYRPDGTRKYEYVVRAGTVAIEVEAKRIFHIPGLSFDGLIGYSPLHYARETLADTIALREYGSRVMSNDARPGVILKHPDVLSDLARENLKKSWQSEHGGFSNAGRTAVLEEGMDVTVLGLPRDDLLFLEARKWQVSEVARWLRLAPHKIGDLERATFSNIEEQNIDHVSSTLQSWLTRWEQQLDKDVLPEPDLFAEHLLDAALRGKTLERYQAYAIAVQNKAMVPNEWRTYENWNPVAWGDEPVVTPNNSAAAPPPEPEPPKASPDAVLYADLIREARKEAAPSQPPVNINMTQPDPHVININVEPPPVNIDVAAAQVSVNPTPIEVAAPVVNVEAPAVSVAAPQVIVQTPDTLRIESMPTRVTKRTVTKRDQAGAIAETLDIEADAGE